MPRDGVVGDPDLGCARRLGHEITKALERRLVDRSRRQPEYRTLCAGAIEEAPSFSHGVCHRRHDVAFLATHAGQLDDAVVAGMSQANRGLSSVYPQHADHRASA